MFKPIPKIANKILGGAVATVFSVLVALSVSAETSNGVTLSVVTDKSSYNANEQVTVSVSAHNDNDYSISNVSISTTLPNGFSVVGSHATYIYQSELASQGNIQDSYVISKNSSTNGNNYPSTNPSNSSPSAGTTNPTTSENNNNAEDISAGGSITEKEDIINTSNINVIKFVIAFLLSFAAISGILLVKRKKDIKKILSIFLVIGFTAPTFSNLSSIDVAAENGKITDFFNFTYDGQEYTVSAVMTYLYNEDGILTLMIENPL